MDQYSLISAHPVRSGVLVPYAETDLLILAGEDYLEAALADSAGGRVFSCVEFSVKGGPDSFGSLIRSAEIFHKPYRSCILGMESRTSTLLPAPLFDERRLPDYLSLGQDIPAGHTLRKDELPGSDIVNAYSLPQDLLSALLSHLSPARIVHYKTALLAGFSMAARRSAADGLVCCHIRHGRLDLAVFRSGKPVFSNSFLFSNRDELVYYILFVLDQLGMNPVEQEARFFGETGPDDALISYCSEYLGETSAEGMKMEGLTSLVSGPFPFHRYANLLSLRLCG